MKKTLSGWILEASVFCGVFVITVVFVRFVGGTDIFAGGWGSINAIFAVNILNNKLLKNPNHLN